MESWIEIGNYTVTETTKDVDGNDVTVTYKVNGGEAADGDAADFTIEDGETTTVDFEDDYTKQPGILEITKTIKGDVTPEEAKGLLTFEVKTTVIEDGYTLKLEELEAGEYTVIETDKDVDGNDVTVTYKVNGGDSQTGEETTAAVEGGKTTTVEFEDDYTKKAEAGKGNLELVKTIKGDITEEEAEGALTFVVATTVTEDGQEVTKYLKADGTLTDNAEERDHEGHRWKGCHRHLQRGRRREDRRHRDNSSSRR